MPPNLATAKAKEVKMNNSKYELECVEVMTTFVILIDQEVKNLTEIAIAIEAPKEIELEIQMYCGESPYLTLDNINSHLAGCVPCSLELIHERTLRNMARESLRRSCNEEAPSELHEALGAMFNQANFAGFKNEVITEFSMHEVTIEIDEFGNIEHREIHVESRTEYRNEEDK